MPLASPPTMLDLWYEFYEYAAMRAPLPEQDLTARPAREPVQDTLPPPRVGVGAAQSSSSRSPPTPFLGSSPSPTPEAMEYLSAGQILPPKPTLRATPEPDLFQYRATRDWLKSDVLPFPPGLALPPPAYPESKPSSPAIPSSNKAVAVGVGLFTGCEYEGVTVEEARNARRDSVVGFEVVGYEGDACWSPERGWPSSGEDEDEQSTGVATPDEVVGCEYEAMECLCSGFTFTPSERRDSCVGNEGDGYRMCWSPERDYYQVR